MSSSLPAPLAWARSAVTRWSAGETSPEIAMIGRVQGRREPPSNTAELDQATCARFKAHHKPGAEARNRQFEPAVRRRAPLFERCLGRPL